MNLIIEQLFMDYLEAPRNLIPAELLAELGSASEAVDVALKAGTLTADTVADYEYSAQHLAFYMGFKAALALSACAAA